MANQFKRDYDKLEEQNDVTIVGIGSENTFLTLVFDVTNNILLNLKLTLFPIVLELINFILIGNFGKYEDINQLFDIDIIYKYFGTKFWYRSHRFLR
jgi:hypothetical protein